MSDSDKAEQKNENPTAHKGPGEKTTGAETTPAQNTTAQAANAKQTANNTAPNPPQRKSLAAPRVWPAMFVLTLCSSIIGAGIATYYWTSPAGNSRLAQLETRLAEIDAASGAEQNLRGDLNAFDVRLGQFDARLGQIDSRVTNLENTPVAPAAPPATAAPNAIENSFDPRLAQLAARLSAIENAVPTDLATRLESFAPRDAQAALSARVTELEQSNNGETLLRAGRILALSDLSRAAAGSQPFPIAVEAAAATLPGEAVIDALRSHAAEGAPTLAQLNARFPEAARQALAAERTSSAENIFARLWNRFTGLISIRRVGNVEGDDSGARLARAEAALGREDLAAAADEVAALEGAASQSMRPWLEDARARLAIENAVAGINARIVQMLADQNTSGQNLPANAP